MAKKRTPQSAARRGDTDGVAEYFERVLGERSYTAIPARVMESKRYTPATKLVLAKLMDLARRNLLSTHGAYRPGEWRADSVATLARECGVKRDTVTAAIAALEKDGVIVLTRFVKAGQKCVTYMIDVMSRGRMLRSERKPRKTKAISRTIPKIQPCPHPQNSDMVNFGEGSHQNSGSPIPENQVRPIPKDQGTSIPKNQGTSRVKLPEADSEPAPEQFRALSLSSPLGASLSTPKHQAESKLDRTTVGAVLKKMDDRSFRYKPGTAKAPSDPSEDERFRKLMEENAIRCSSGEKRELDSEAQRGSDQHAN